MEQITPYRFKDDSELKLHYEVPLACVFTYPRVSLQDPEITYHLSKSEKDEFQLLSYVPL